MNNFDSKMVGEILYLMNEYHSGDYSKAEFEGKVSTLVREGKISSEASVKVIEMIFTFEHDPGYGTIQSNGGCGASVRRPHWQPGFGQSGRRSSGGSYNQSSRSYSSSSC